MYMGESEADEAERSYVYGRVKQLKELPRQKGELCRRC